MKRKVVVLVASLFAALAVTSTAAAGSQYVGASPWVYNQTRADYTNYYEWYMVVGYGQYHWYVFTTGGALKAQGTNNSTGGAWGDGWNYYYWKFQNQGPVTQGFDVYWSEP
jgi:hypothetical protein